MRVVVIILLEQLFSGKAHFIVSHTCIDHTSSMMMRYLIDLADIIKQAREGIEQK
jgi:hypothetical protein